MPGTPFARSRVPHRPTAERSECWTTLLTVRFACFGPDLRHRWLRRGLEWLLRVGRSGPRWIERRRPGPMPAIREVPKFVGEALRFVRALHQVRIATHPVERLRLQLWPAWWPARRWLRLRVPRCGHSPIPMKLGETQVQLALQQRRIAQHRDRSGRVPPERWLPHGQLQIVLRPGRWQVVLGRLVSERFPVVRAWPLRRVQPKRFSGLGLEFVAGVPAGQSLRTRLAPRPMLEPRGRCQVARSARRNPAQTFPGETPVH